MKIEASSDLYTRVGHDRFRSLATRAVQTFTRLTPIEARLAAGECAHRAWVSTRVGGSWSSLVLVIDESPGATRPGANPTGTKGHGWTVVLVPRGCALKETDEDDL